MLIGLFGLTLLWAVKRRERSRVAASARRVEYFPLELPSQLVHRIGKHLTKRIMDESRPRMESAQDIYYSRIRLERGEAPGRFKALRSDKCYTIQMALSSISQTREEELRRTDDAVVLHRTERQLLPLLTPELPQTFSLEFGQPTKANPFHGWPLLEEIGMTREEHALFPPEVTDVNHHALFNPIVGQTVRFFQGPTAPLKVGSRSLQAMKVTFTGAFSGQHVVHRVEGALWLAAGIGVIKEERQINVKFYPRPLWDGEKKVFRYLTKAVTVFETRTVKLLAHPIEES
ncbi:MAG: hypothetical protein HY815_24515 [Candidatus Riflebacteria bacterium]|nr:hypothetical protein [Candidatus Riflebacteria bacterium]